MGCEFCRKEGSCLTTMKKKPRFQEGEYLLSDPELLQNMRLIRDIKVPGSEAIFVSCYTLITPKLLDQLRASGFVTLFAEPVKEKTVSATIEHMDKMFQVIDQIVKGAIGDINDLDERIESWQQQRDQKILENLVRKNLSEIQDFFTIDPTEKLVALTQYHTPTARHSIIASFHMMSLGRELGWSDTKIVKAAVAVFNHDVGKSKIKLETLNWPGRLNNEQWKEIQYHPLLGALMLHRPGTKPDVCMLTCLLHHEWYARIDGKGYGGLTLFLEYLKRSFKIDIADIISKIDQDTLDIIHASSLTDMVSALEERRSYKRALDAFKVMIIMNSDAKMGHFHPEHYRAWHRIYLRQHPNLLPLGLRVALPREKEQRVFYHMQPKILGYSIALLTYYELEKLGFLPSLVNVGMDMERIRRRGGLLLNVVQQMKEDKGLSFDCSRPTLEAQGVKIMKKSIFQEEEVIELEAWREWLTWEELERCELLTMIKMLHFDQILIRKEGGISPDRLVKRGVKVSIEKLRSKGIELLKKWTVRLPASENRLTAGDLDKLGITDEQLKKAGCLERVQKVKNGVSMKWLMERGIVISAVEVAKCGIDPMRKVFYDIMVTQEINTVQAKFLILREGDDPAELELANERKELDPIQEHLFHRVGQVVLDFADLLAMPDLSSIHMGSQWGHR